MLRRVHWLCLLGIGGFALIAWADPVNFMIGEIVFPRPEKWKWVQAEKNWPTAVLEVTGEKTKEKANVNFGLYLPGNAKGTVEATKQRWLDTFEKVPAPEVRVQEITLGKHKFVRMEMEGVRKGESAVKKDSLPSFSRFSHYSYGGVVLSTNGNIAIRVAGSPEFIRELKPDFDTMMQGALEE